MTVGSRVAGFVTKWPSLIREVSREIRRKLAVRIADAPGTPRELAVLLANDEIDIASPMLLRSKVLEDVDLIEIVRTRSTQHLLAIAMRRDLSTAVADALVVSKTDLAPFAAVLPRFSSRTPD